MPGDVHSAHRASQCRNSGCENPATRTLTFPLSYGAQSVFEGRYCDEHADLILGDKMVFPGAREVDHAA